MQEPGGQGHNFDGSELIMPMPFWARWESLQRLAVSFYFVKSIYADQLRHGLQVLPKLRVLAFLDTNGRTSADVLDRVVNSREPPFMVKIFDSDEHGLRSNTAGVHFDVYEHLGLDDRGVKLFVIKGPKSAQPTWESWGLEEMRRYHIFEEPIPQKEVPFFQQDDPEFARGNCASQ